MASNNRLWGAERIRGELSKLGIRVSKRTIQKYLARSRVGGGGQTWSTFVKNHARDIRFLIRDRDDKFGTAFDRAAEGVGVRVIKTAVRPRT